MGRVLDRWRRERDQDFVDEKRRKEAGYILGGLLASAGGVVALKAGVLNFSSILESFHKDPEGTVAKTQAQIESSYGLTSQGVNFPPLSSDPLALAGGTQYYNAATGQMHFQDGYANANRTVNAWKDFSGAPFVTVSPVGTAQGYPVNNGANFGPDDGPNFGIQNAVNSGKSSIYLLSGNYTGLAPSNPSVGGNIFTLPSNIEISGAGINTVLQVYGSLMSPGLGNTHMFYANGQSNIYIHDLLLDQNFNYSLDTLGGQDLIECHNGTNIRVENVTAQDIDSGAFEFYGTTNVRVRGCNFLNSFGDFGVYLSSAPDAIVAHNYFTGGGLTGIGIVNSPTYATIIGNVSDNCSTLVNTNGFSGVIAGNIATNCKNTSGLTNAVGVSIGSSTGNAFFLWSLNGATVVGNTASQCDAEGFDLQSAETTTFSGNTVARANNAGGHSPIHIGTTPGPGPNPLSLVVSSNTVYSAGGTPDILIDSPTLGGPVLILNNILSDGTINYSAVSTGLGYLRVAGNSGYNPLGFAISTPAVAATTVDVTNTNPFQVRIYILTAGSATGWAITDPSGTKQVMGAAPLGIEEVTIDPGAKIQFTYAAGAPTWKWYGT